MDAVNLRAAIAVDPHNPSYASLLGASPWRATWDVLRCVRPYAAGATVGSVTTPRRPFPPDDALGRALGMQPQR